MLMCTFTTVLGLAAGIAWFPPSTAWVTSQTAPAIDQPASGASSTGVSEPSAESTPTVSFEREILPLFKERCSSCHGAVKQEGGLRLDAGRLVLQGASQAIVQPGNARESELIRRLTTEDEAERMPPIGARVSPDQLAAITTWIDSGAAIPAHEEIPTSPAEHWAFRSIVRPAVPVPQTKAWARNPIDAFLLADWEAASRLPPPDALPGALLRRVTLDLIGLPPSLDDQDRFALDQDLDRVINDLLSRPEYGERWARHWLDVVRYADSNGYERDAEKPFVWRYRDYVINAFNDDLPFNRFIVEQLAGDELPDRSLSSQIATGFLRLGHWDDEPADPETDRYDQLDDLVSTTGQAFLGLTIGCARCHDHKFEPLTTQDYYSLVAVFAPLERPRDGRTEKAIPVENIEVYAWREPETPPAPTYILKRGSPTSPGAEVTPAVPAILATHPAEFPQADDRSSRRRLGLAQWIAQPDNPLTSRVIVNRVWQQHFGQGLVTTASDFGLMGARPVHPQLLDWLAHWFMHDAGWSLKRLHRLILTSHAWQTRASADSLVRYRRLEVEAIRDSMLSVSGRLNPQRFGPAMRPHIPAAILEANSDKSSIWKPSEEWEASRRSLYAFVKRSLVLPLFETLDLADTVSSCPQRQITTVAPQALVLFNGDFTNQQARHFAVRLRTAAGADPAAQVRLAWRLAVCREPTPAEHTAAIAFVQQESLEQLCRVVLNLNEFVYPE